MLYEEANDHHRLSKVSQMYKDGQAIDLMKLLLRSSKAYILKRSLLKLFGVMHDYIT